MRAVLGIEGETRKDNMLRGHRYGGTVIERICRKGEIWRG
jgi:hypothetical protein